MQAVLLLNASYEPLKVISWQRAVCLFFSGKVEIIEEYNQEIRSVSIIIKAPAVVRLLEYVKLGIKKPALSRTNILARDGFRCQYCLKELNYKNATLDHIIPRSKGGKASWQNLVCCCAKCNRKKGNSSLEQVKMKLAKTPIRPEWLPVIRINIKEDVPTKWSAFIEAFTRNK